MNTNTPPRRRLPGDPDPARARAGMVRVDHAGEYGAARIYAGQLAVLGKSASAPLLREMAAAEHKHLDTFKTMIGNRHVRPTALLPFWHLAGFALGAGTALLGEKAAMACTAAIEDVIDQHYGAQEAELASGTPGMDDPELGSIVTTFRAEEVIHRDTAIAHGAEQAPGYRLLSGAIKAGCRFAIAISEKV